MIWNCKRIVYGVKRTLTLVRGNDDNAIYRYGTVDGKVELTNISWHIPEVELNPLYEGAIMEKIRNKETFSINFPTRTWNEDLADELHKSVRRKFHRSRVITHAIDDIWSSDLV